MAKREQKGRIFRHLPAADWERGLGSGPSCVLDGTLENQLSTNPLCPKTVQWLEILKRHPLSHLSMRFHDVLISKAVIKIYVRVSMEGHFTGRYGNVLRLSRLGQVASCRLSCGCPTSLPCLG